MLSILFMPHNKIYSNMLLILVAVIMICLPASDVMARQFIYKPPYTLELQLRYESQQAYVFSKPQTLISYGIQFEHSLIYYRGRPPFDYEAGFVFQEDDLVDPRITSEARLFFRRTLGRLGVKRRTDTALPVAPENLAGLFVRRRILGDWLSLELEAAQDLGIQFSHGGQRVAGAIRMRYLTLPNAKFYFSRSVFYGNETYVKAWFNTRRGIANPPLKAGLYESQDNFSFIGNLSKKTHMEFNFYRANLLGSAANSNAVRNQRNNGVSIIYAYRF